MRTAIVLLTRDLRVPHRPARHARCHGRAALLDRDELGQSVQRLHAVLPGLVARCAAAGPACAAAAVDAGRERLSAWLRAGVVGYDTNHDTLAGDATSRLSPRFDPEGAYVRRFVNELAAIEGLAVHEPWKLRENVPGYPTPIVDPT